MKISCNIIRDLLPLYAEDLASEDTRALVDEHLRDCEDCAKALSSMEKKPPVIVETAAESLNKVKKLIRRRRLVSVLAAVMTVITVASAVFTYLFTPFQLTKEQALDDFYVREDGAVVIDYSSAVMGRMRFGTQDNRFFLQYSTRYDMWKGLHRKSIEEVFGTDGIITDEERMRYENIDVIKGYWARPDGSYFTDDPMFVPPAEDWFFVTESNSNWWYADPCGLGRDILLHDAGKSHAHQYLFSPAYPMLFFGGILAALALLVLRKFTKKPGVKELETRILMFVCSLVLSTLFVSNGRIFTAYVGVIDQYWGWLIPMNTAFLTLTVLFWRQLYLLNKQDKAI